MSFPRPAKPKTFSMRNHNFKYRQIPAKFAELVSTGPGLLNVWEHAAKWPWPRICHPDSGKYILYMPQADLLEKRTGEDYPDNVRSTRLIITFLLPHMF
jgi:hypothetical protein